MHFPLRGGHVLVRYAQDDNLSRICAWHNIFGGALLL